MDIGDVSDALDPEAGLPILAVVALAAVVAVAVIAAGWVVWSAPVLMAELLVDAAIAGGLYRRMRRTQAQGWWCAGGNHPDGSDARMTWRSAAIRP